MQARASLFDRLVGRPRRTWPTVVVALALLAAPALAAAVDGAIGGFFHQGTWRLMIYPAIVVYILAVAPRLGSMDRAVIQSFRSISPVEEPVFQRLVREATTIQPVHELLVLACGAALGYLSIFGGEAPAAQSWLDVCWIVLAALMYAMLAWTVYVSFVSTRLTSALHRLPLQVDPFDTSPFEAIGRQALLLALVFIGGITLSLLFVGFRPESLQLPEFWLAYLPPALVPVLLFFLNMLPTHQVLLRAKRRELGAEQALILGSCRALADSVERHQQTGTLAAEINAFTSYEQRLQQTRTWPYNIGMLRTLFFSVLVPGLTVLARVLAGTWVG